MTTMMNKAKLDINYDIEEAKALAYAQGRKDAGAKGVIPGFFAESYVNALRSWNESDGGPKRWIGLAGFYRQYVRAFS